MKMIEEKTPLRIGFADIGNNGVIKKFILQVLSKRWQVEICEKPDYLFCGDFFTYEFLEYDCIKIYISAENEFPNFNLYDYVLGNIDFHFEDRFIRWSFYLWRDGSRRKFELACQKHINVKEGDAKRKFCNFIVSNGGNADSYRTKLFEKLNEYKKVDSGGRYLNNLGYIVDDKLKFVSDYKFSITCENSMQRGHITEKIIEAWASGTIPIYWGDVDISDEFNEKAFINCMKYEKIEDVIEYVKEIDNDEKNIWRC